MGIYWEIFWFLLFVQICPMDFLGGAFLNIFALHFLKDWIDKICSRNQSILFPEGFSKPMHEFLNLGALVQICPRNFEKIFFRILTKF